MKTEERTDFLDRDQLRLYFEQGCKPYSEWGIGCLLYTSPSPRDQRGSGLAACA